MRSAYILLLFLFPAVLCHSLMAGKIKQSVMLEVEFSGELAKIIDDRSYGEPIRCQVLLLHLHKGFVYFHSDYSLQTRYESEGRPEGLFRELLSLDKGEYLLQLLVYDTLDDLFTLRAMEILADPGKSAKQMSVNFRVDGLGYDKFQKRKKHLIYNPGRSEELFADHMLWLNIRKISKRPRELWDDIYIKYKILASEMNYSALHREYVTRRYSGRGPSGHLAFAVMEKIFQIVLHTDNINYLASEIPREDSNQPKVRKSLLKEISKNASWVDNYCSFLYVDRQLGFSLDRKEFKQMFTGLDNEHRLKFFEELVKDLSRIVKDMFFGGQTVQLNALSSETPQTLANKIEMASGILRKNL